MKLTSGLVVVLLAFVGPDVAGATAAPITSLAFSPDGREVLVGSQDGLEVRSWPELKAIRRLATELIHIHDLAFAPDGKTLAAVGGTPARSGIVELIAWPEGSLRQRFRPHRDLILAVAWGPDSAALATASADRSVRLLDASTGRMIRQLEGHSRGVLAAAFLSQDAGLVTAGLDESIRHWNVETGQCLRTLANHTRAVTALACPPQITGEKHPLVASGGEDRTVRLWQPTLGRLVRFTRLKSVPLALSWTAVGDALLAACRDGHVRVIDPETLTVRNDLPALDGPAYCIAVRPGGGVLVGGSGGQLHPVAWD